MYISSHEFKIFIDTVFYMLYLFSSYCCPYLLILQVNSLHAKYPKLQFEYSDPERGFDRHRVKGLVANLFHVPDRKHCLALEVAAGTCILYNVQSILFDTCTVVYILGACTLAYNVYRWTRVH